MATWKLVGNSTGVMTASMSGEAWKEKIEAADARLRMRSIQVGTDPEKVERADILNAAVNLSLQEMYQQAVEELELSPISEAVIEVPELTSEGVTVDFRFAVTPEFELGDLSGLKYEIANVIVSNEDIDAEIAELKKSISEQGQQIPEDDDEFARGFGIEGVETMDDLRGNINDALIRSREEKARVDAENQMLDELCRLVGFEAPDGMVDMEVDSMIATDKDKVASMNGEWEEFLKSARKTETELKEEYRPEAARSIKIRLILEKVAAENSLYPAGEEVEAEYTAMANAYGVPIEELKSAIPESDIIYQKSLVMAMDYLKKC